MRVTMWAAGPCQAREDLCVQRVRTQRPWRLSMCCNKGLKVPADSSRCACWPGCALMRLSLLAWLRTGAGACPPDC